MMAATRARRILEDISFVPGASEAVLDQIAAALVEEVFDAGQVVFKKGEDGTSLYIISAGRVCVHDGDLVFRHMGVGEVFGEMAALDSDARTASVVATEPSTLLRLDQDSLYDLMATHLEAARAVIRGMCRNQRHMARDVTNRSQEVRLLQQELAIGRQIQSGFLPDQLPDVAGWELTSFFKAAREVAGDFYDAFVIKANEQIAFVIGDVCDKGVGAALFMALVRSLLRASLLRDDFVTSQPSDNQVLDPMTRLIDSVSLTNNYIADTHGHTGMFASLFFGLIDVKTGQLTYINAGHEAPLILSGAQTLRELHPTGPVIGIIPEVTYEIGKAPLEKGDLLFACTDGVTDAMDAAGNHFTRERLIGFLEEHAHEDDIVARVEKRLETYIGEADPFDDIAMLSARRK